MGRVRLGGSQAPVILMYHRVAAPPFDPFGLCVAPAIFARQIAWLRSKRTVVSTDELVATLRSRRPATGSIAVTFDDGYADNAAVAAPILAREGCPATVFVTTGAIDSGNPYWWDELAALVIGSQEAARFDIRIPGIRLTAEWGRPDGATRAIADWRVGMPAPDARCAAYLALWKQLQRADAEARDQAMAALRHHLPRPANLDDETIGRPMNGPELRSLTDMGVYLGGHARTHTPLPLGSVSKQREEIEGGRHDLAILSETYASGFAYPYGQWDRQTRSAVRQAGFSWAVTTKEMAVNPQRYDLYALPRLAVGNWEEIVFEQRLASIGG